MTVPLDASGTPRREHPWIRRLRWPALVIGLLLVGGAGSYLLLPPTTVSSDTPVQVDPNQLLANRSRTAQPMPSILGLERPIAAAVLGDAGIGADRVAVIEKPAAGPAGIVLRQTPAAGAATDGAVSLTVSTPALVPDVTGRPEADGRRAIEELGAVVRVVRDVNFDAPHGTVLAVEPPVGQPSSTVVTVHVADAGDALTLSKVRPVKSDCSGATDVTADGRTYANAVTCTSRAGKTVAAEYALSRGAAALETAVSTADRDGTGRATVTFFADDRPVSTTSIGLGRTENVRVDTRGVLRLRIEVTTGDKDQAPTVVLGDARLIGSTDSLDVIAGNK